MRRVSLTPPRTDLVRRAVIAARSAAASRVRDNALDGSVERVRQAMREYDDYDSLARELYGASVIEAECGDL